jgi:hypothetical protein
MTPEREKEIRVALEMCAKWREYEDHGGSRLDPDEVEIALKIPDDELELWFRDLIAALDEERIKVRKMEQKGMMR